MKANDTETYGLKQIPNSYVYTCPEARFEFVSSDIKEQRPTNRQMAIGFDGIQLQIGIKEFHYFTKVTYTSDLLLTTLQFFLSITQLNFIFLCTVLLKLISHLSEVHVYRY